MRRRTPLLGALLAAVVATMTIAPAHADPAPPTLGTPDTSVPGAVSGTATSDQAFVLVRLDANRAWTAEPVDSGTSTATYQLDTWGFGAGVTLHAVACPTDTFDAAACSPEQTAGFDANDVTPTVSWKTGNPAPHQDDVGAAGLQADVTDTGGGSLVATWTPTSGAPVTTTLTTGTDEPVAVTDGTGTMTVQRCSTVVGDTAQCVSYASLNQSFTVRQTLHLTADPVAAITTAHPSTTVQLTSDIPSTTTPLDVTYDLTWSLIDNADSSHVLAPTNVLTSGAVRLDGTMDPVTIAPASFTDPLADGSYTVRVVVTVHDPAYGDYTQTLSGPTAPQLTVDHSGPDVTLAASPGTIYPLIGNATRPGSTRLTLSGPDVGQVTDLTLVSGATTVHLAPGGTGQVTWYGRTTGASTGTIVPAGTYTVRAYDADGNVTTLSPTVVVSGKRLIAKTFTRTVTAAGSLHAPAGQATTFIGRCSTLRRPALRPWPGSLGFYSDSRCAPTGATGGLVGTVHGVQLPSAESYTDVRVNTYGGQARAVLGSQAIIRFLLIHPASPNSPWNRTTSLLTPVVRTHTGPRLPLTGMVSPQRWFYWGVATNFGNRYDVKNFTVTVHYTVLG